MSNIVQVHYPLRDGELVLRTDADWGRDIEPTAQSGNSHFTFEVDADRPFTWFKPCLRHKADLIWASGGNYLLLIDDPIDMEVHPHFFTQARGDLSPLLSFPSKYFDKAHHVRVFLPAGYHENTIKHYPVLYMHDGNNLFLPQEASFGETWEIEEVLDQMDALNIVRQVIVVGVWPVDRMVEYTKPGYVDYGKFLVEELKPAIDSRYRTLPERENCAVMGSSLGGVVSFYLGWEYPQVYGMAGCLSSTFGYKDDLRGRVINEPKRDVKLYLDSGTPGDNYEVTKDMYELLCRRGYESGKDVLFFSFPDAVHNEKYWAMRSHLPYQFFFQRD